MKIGQLCSREVYVVEPTESLLEALRQMCRRHVGSVVVVEVQGGRRQPIGIVTDRDAACARIERADLADLRVADVMSSELLVLSEELDMFEAIGRMRARSVRRAPVVNPAGQLVGLLSFDDLLPVLAEELSALARLAEEQPRRER